MSELNRRSDVADPPPEPSRRPKPTRPTDDVQAELARLMGHRPPSDRPALRQPEADRRERPEPDAKLEKAQAEIAELRSRLEERDTKLEAAEAKISALESRLDSAKSGFDDKVGALESVIGDLQSRMKRLEHAEPEKRADEVSGPSKADERMLTRDERREQKAKPEWVRKVTSDSSLGFMSSGVGVALTEASAHMPPGPAHVATLAGGLFGFAVSGMAWIRDWRKNRNADRSQG